VTLHWNATPDTLTFTQDTLLYTVPKPPLAVLLSHWQATPVCFSPLPLDESAVVHAQGTPSGFLLRFPHTQGYVVSRATPWAVLPEAAPWVNALWVCPSTPMGFWDTGTLPSRWPDMVQTLIQGRAYTPPPPAASPRHRAFLHRVTADPLGALAVWGHPQFDPEGLTVPAKALALLMETPEVFPLSPSVGTTLVGAFLKTADPLDRARCVGFSSRCVNATLWEGLWQTVTPLERQRMIEVELNAYSDKGLYRHPEREARLSRWKQDTPQEHVVALIKKGAPTWSSSAWGGLFFSGCLEGVPVASLRALGAGQQGRWGEGWVNEALDRTEIEMQALSGARPHLKQV
jgi:hypothetical protein